MWNSRWSTYHFASVSGFGEAIAVCSNPLNISWIVAGTRLPVKFQAELHGARRVQQIAVAGEQTKVRIAQLGGTRAEAHAVQHVESLPAEIDTHLFTDCERLR